MYDSYDNQVKVDNLLPISYFNSFIIGPTNKPTYSSTQRITDISAYGDGSGTYKVTIFVITSGSYEIYMRINTEQIKTYPVYISAVSNQVSAPNCVITETPLSPSIAGQDLLLSLYVYDLYDNPAVEEIIPISAEMVLSDLNITVVGTVTKLETAVYQILFVPTIRGDYQMNIKIFDRSEAYTFIKDFPQTQTIYPDDISIDESSYVGSSLVNGRFGFVESFYLYLRDKYQNLYYQSTIYYNGVNNPVYLVEYKADDVDTKPVLLISSDPDQGEYQLGYRIINAYSYLYIRIWLFVTSDGGVTYSYQPVNDFPIIVSIVFSPDDLLNEYTNLYQGGIGITEMSVLNITNVAVASESLQKIAEFYPRNAYNLNYIYNDDLEYLIIDILPNDINEYCLCNSDIDNYSSEMMDSAMHNRSDLAFSLKFCRQFSYSKASCELYGLCRWIPQTSQSKNYNEGDCQPYK